MHLSDDEDTSNGSIDVHYGAKRKSGVSTIAEVVKRTSGRFSDETDTRQPMINVEVISADTEYGRHFFLVFCFFSSVVFVRVVKMCPMYFVFCPGVTFDIV